MECSRSANRKLINVLPTQTKQTSGRSGTAAYPHTKRCVLLHARAGYSWHHFFLSSIRRRCTCNNHLSVVTGAIIL